MMTVDGYRGFDLAAGGQMGDARVHMIDSEAAPLFRTKYDLIRGL
jgi:hypothetical protein